VRNGNQQSTLEGTRSSEPRAVAGPELGQAFQEQIGQALQPAMAELREQIAASVRRELDQQRHQDGRRREPHAKRTMEHGTESREQSPRQSATGRDDHEDEQERSDVAHAGSRSRTAEHSSDVDSQGWDADDFSDQGPSNERAEPRAIARPDLGQALQEQICQALQPAIAEFREQMAATVQRELDEALHRDRRRPQRETQQTSDRGPEAEEADPGRGADHSTDEGRSKASESTSQHGSQTLLPLHGKPLREALSEILEQQGEQWLRSRLDLGVDFVLSDEMHSAVQRDAERTLQLVARAPIALISDRAIREDLGAQSEQLVKTLVRTALDKLFADDVREELKSRGHQAVHALFQPDLKSILHHLQELLVALLEGLLAALRECWEQVLQFLVRVVTALLQSRLSSVLKDAFASLVTTPGRDVAKQGTDSPTASEDKEVEPRPTLTETTESMPQPGSRESSGPRQRVENDDASAGGGGEQDHQRLGRAPSGREPSGRAPSTRQTSGRPVSDRSASGRPSRAAR
jgi:hypothetical protein